MLVLQSAIRIMLMICQQKGSALILSCFACLPWISTLRSSCTVRSSCNVSFSCNVRSSCSVTSFSNVRSFCPCSDLCKWLARLGCALKATKTKPAPAPAGLASCAKCLAHFGCALMATGSALESDNHCAKNNAGKCTSTHDHVGNMHMHNRLAHALQFE